MEKVGGAGARCGGDAASFFTEPARRPDEEPASRSCFPLRFQKPMASRWPAGELDKGGLGFSAVGFRGGRGMEWGSVDDDRFTGSSFKKDGDLPLGR